MSRDGTGPRRIWLAIAHLLVYVIGEANAATSNASAAYYIAHPHPTTPEAATQGSGYAFAESCQAALRAWSSSSSSYGALNITTSTSYFTSDMTIHSELPGTTEIYSLITLCDDYPRVVGRVSSSEGKTETIVTTWTNTNPTVVLGSYPTPAPCSIGPGDCKLLYSSWTRHWDSRTQNGISGGLLDPPCTTSTSSHSYSTNSKGGMCDNCQVIGSKIRLLYWPVITEQGGGNLCSGSAQTLTLAPTGSGPNTFLTMGITITSPSVAVSIGGLSRVDQCGTTIAETIIPVLPEEVSSVEGARALFTHRPFNFANLNYKCLSDPDTIFMTTGARTDCYQEVPASAYFLGLANAAGADWWNPTAFVNSTIWPNYQPQVLPPNTLTHAIRSLWGEDCNIHPDGVWDPPIALGHETEIPAPEAGCTTITYLTPTSTPAMPAPSAAYVSQTSPAAPSTARQETANPTPTIPLPPSHDTGAAHSTVLALGGSPANGELTIKQIGDGWAVMDAETTIFVEPAETSGQVVSLHDGPYTAQILQSGGLKLVGKSTTVSMAGNSVVASDKSPSTTATSSPVETQHLGKEETSPNSGTKTDQIASWLIVTAWLAFMFAAQV